MDLKTVSQTLQELVNQTNQWVSQGFTPNIEKDIFLRQLQDIYQALNTHNSAPSNNTIIVEPLSLSTHTPSKSLGSNTPTVEEPISITIFNQQITTQQADIFIRELFWRDATLFQSEVKKLESLPDLDSAVIYISEKYNWSIANQYASQFVEMLEKYY